MPGLGPGPVPVPVPGLGLGLGLGVGFELGERTVLVGEELDHLGAGEALVLLPSLAKVSERLSACHGSAAAQRGAGVCAGVCAGLRRCLHDGGIVDAEDVDLVDPSLLKTAVDLGCLEARDLARGSRGRERARERDHQHVALGGERLDRQVLLEVDLVVARVAAARLQVVVEREAARRGARAAAMVG